MIRFYYLTISTKDYKPNREQP